jgi:hypothetical protein
MTNDEVKKCGNFIMNEKKNSQANLKPSEQRRWSDEPLYQKDPDPRAELGYNRPDPIPQRPRMEWANQVLEKQKSRSELESPLKEWWKSEQAKKGL